MQTPWKRGNFVFMGRARQERRKFAEEQWPLLSNLMACYFNQDFDIIHGSLTGAINAALHDGSLEHRRAVLKEWRDWNASEGAVNDIRPSLHDGFSVAIWFDEPIDARNFMNRIYDGLMERVRAETRDYG
ncbi:MAG: contact-dependent growth inhibition system immunity protein [Sphingopyxis sp.]|uniref:contact-dependent growth inhibition system immunity protein n=1 Tax=Sphingopyxis sp. TaxID=1908224 RepID=UPI003F722E2C